MDVVQMAVQIHLIPNRVFPKPSLPDAVKMIRQQTKRHRFERKTPAYFHPGRTEQRSRQAADEDSEAVMSHDGKEKGPTLDE
jgi:hypothetical protein